MNGYVSKPVRKEELEAALHTYTQLLVTDDTTLVDGMISTIGKTRESIDFPVEHASCDHSKNESDQSK
jgi:hypothetical protein